MLHMKIGICDDNVELCLQLKKLLLIGKHLQKTDTLFLFHTATELLENENTPTLDLLFLDIELPDMSGIEFMRRFNHIFRHTKVVFLTSHLEYLIEGYEVNIYRYLKKPIQQEKLIELFESMEQNRVLDRKINIRQRGQDISIRIGDIVYAEVNNNYIQIITKQTTWRSYMRLKNLKSMLPEEHFYQPHQSFIINLNYIRDINKKEGSLFMLNGSRIDIPSRNRKQFDRFYTQFILNS